MERNLRKRRRSRRLADRHDSRKLLSEKSKQSRFVATPSPELLAGASCLLEAAKEIENHARSGVRRLRSRTRTERGLRNRRKIRAPPVTPEPSNESLEGSSHENEVENQKEIHHKNQSVNGENSDAASDIVSDFVSANGSTSFMKTEAFTVTEESSNADEDLDEDLNGPVSEKEQEVILEKKVEKRDPLYVYTREERCEKIQKYLVKKRRFQLGICRARMKYPLRTKFAKFRPRIGGRFVKTAEYDKIMGEEVNP